MQVFQGTGIGDGIAIGRLHIVRKKAEQELPISISDAEAEVIRYRIAVEQVGAGLRQLYEAACARVGQAEAAVFEAHQMLLKDEAYQQSVEEVIHSRMVDAAYAVAVTRDRFANMFAEMEDPYMRERAADIRDVSNQLIQVLKAGRLQEAEREGAASDHGLVIEPSKFQNERTADPVILVAENLTPSETIGLDPDRVQGIVAVRGSVYSHTAILARVMGIPALVNCPIPLEEWREGSTCILEAGTGKLYVEPEPEFLVQMERKQRVYRETAREQQKQLGLFKEKETATLDGQKIKLYANIKSDKDLPLVLENGAEGIGLFRSEFLYLERHQAPTEEEQFEIYRTVVETMAGRPVIIRTLDIGGDKQCQYLGLEPEENPALGCRGIRFCLTRPEVFQTQLRALFRASAYGTLAILYSMVTNVEELHRIRQMTEEVKAELLTQGIPFGTVEQGIMIETPAAALISDLLAPEVDFFSIGTNDLTQYTLAMDRQNGRLDGFYDPYHPAVLRMIQMTVENAHKAGIGVSICGELGADLKWTKQFLEWGIEELSVSPEQILPMRRYIRSLDMRKRESGS
ncbi:MAG: phosphoenolpyruvate--protein phosphotransferase [Lachnospiraceae bacterium]|nr:phosphoenolpyruvate--protein phosphotransferase [Lachnospiraceae bacterium]